MQLSKKSMGQISFLILSLFLILGFQNCGSSGFQTAGLNQMESGSLSDGSALSFADIDRKIIQPKCISCHANGAHDFSSYSKLMASGTIVPGNPDQSLLFRDIQNGTMPSSGPRLASNEVQLVSAWISQGALEVVATTTSTIPSSPGSGTDPSGPVGVTELSASMITQNSLTLTWKLPLASVRSVDVERSESSGGPYAVVKTFFPADSSYTDTGLNPGTAYYYRIRATSDQGNLPDSDTLSTVTLP